MDELIARIKDAMQNMRPHIEEKSRAHARITVMHKPERTHVLDDGSEIYEAEHISCIYDIYQRNTEGKLHRAQLVSCIYKDDWYNEEAIRLAVIGAVDGFNDHMAENYSKGAENYIPDGWTPYDANRVQETI